MSKICPNCNKPLDEHYVAKSATLNRPHVYICPMNVCPVDELFEEVPAAPAQPAGELLKLANGWRKLSDKYYESGMEAGDRYRQGMSAVYATCADELLAALGRKGE